MFLRCIFALFLKLLIPLWLLPISAPSILNSVGDMVLCISRAVVTTSMYWIIQLSVGM